MSCPADPPRPRAASSTRNAEHNLQYGRPYVRVVLQFHEKKEQVSWGSLHPKNMLNYMKRIGKKTTSLQILAVLRPCTCSTCTQTLYGPLNVFFWTFRSIRPGVFRFFAIAFLISENELSKVGDIARFSEYLPQADPKYLQGAKRAPPVFPGKK